MASIASEMRELSEKYDYVNVSTQAYLFDQIGIDFDVSKIPDWETQSNFWDEMKRFVPHLEQISLAGGEPTLLKKVHDFLHYCATSGHSKKIKVLLATNFTLLNRNLLEIAKEFKAFEFIASIDGVGPVQEFIRSPSKWEIVKFNFEQTKLKMEPWGIKVLVNITLQIYNILTFTEILDWLEELDLIAPHFYHHPFHLNILNHPKHLSYDLLPPAGRTLAIGRIDDYLSRSLLLQKFPDLKDRFELIKFELKQELPRDYNKRLLTFWKFNYLLDTHRGEALREADPVFYEIVEDEVERLR